MVKPVLAVAAAVLAMLVPAAARASETATLFRHVNVVPMDRDRILADRSVLVVDGRIAAIAGTVAAPAGARIVRSRKAVDGAGREARLAESALLTHPHE